jgi:hypothetical protein
MHEWPMRSVRYQQVRQPSQGTWTRGILIGQERGPKLALHASDKRGLRRSADAVLDEPLGTPHDEDARTARAARFAFWIPLAGAGALGIRVVRTV